MKACLLTCFTKYGNKLDSLLLWPVVEDSELPSIFEYKEVVDAFVVLTCEHGILNMNHEGRSGEQVDLIHRESNPSSL